MRHCERNRRPARYRPCRPARKPPSTPGAGSPAPSPPESHRKKSLPSPRGHCYSARFSPTTRSCRRCPCFRPLPWGYWRHALDGSSQTAPRSHTAREYPETQTHNRPQTYANNDKASDCILYPRRKSRKAFVPEKSAALPWHSSVRKSPCAASPHPASQPSILSSRTAPEVPAAPPPAPKPWAPQTIPLPQYRIMSEEFSKAMPPQYPAKTPRAYHIQIAGNLSLPNVRTECFFLDPCPWIKCCSSRYLMQTTYVGKVQTLPSRSECTAARSSLDFRTWG